MYEQNYRGTVRLREIKEVDVAGCAHSFSQMHTYTHVPFTAYMLATLTAHILEVMKSLLIAAYGLRM